MYVCTYLFIQGVLNSYHNYLKLISLTINKQANTRVHWLHSANPASNNDLKFVWFTNSNSLALSSNIIPPRGNENFVIKCLFSRIKGSIFWIFFCMLP